MNSLTIGDIVQNSVQRAIVRWLGFIEEIPIIGLQLIDSILPGYTDGTCPFDNKRYFNCSNGQGYYILESGFIDSYKIIQKKIEINRLTTSDYDFHEKEQFVPIPLANVHTTQEPIRSFSSPTISQTEPNSDSNHVISPSRGVLSRLTFEREQRRIQMISSIADDKDSFNQRSSIESDLTSSRIYRPENYRSTSYDKSEESQVDELTLHDNENESKINDNGNKNNCPLVHIANNNGPSLSTEDLPSFGQEYFLDNWTLSRVKSLLENQIPIHNKLCLNIFDDQCNVQNLINEQITGCEPHIPNELPNDVCIELIKLFDRVEIIFPSRAIRLYNNDYLLLAILCSNNQCAYIRTAAGWAYADDECDHGQSIVIDEISQMIDCISNDIEINSEQCLHVLKNASFLYYKLVE
ncbi:unnamed protein product [Rotaria sp. Silwood2]|nr:unnamed protein product [Rotaria sp. Silwood2]CAF2512443.1 unnamed protein product [Rotaria sp. Silwood2]CAF2720677.1 unnamed protein product [Rotaria sp. Silwood2]CAF2890427.1 unnamed protein product [Rotaria sp. Silwood2]CAF3862215.1 unnamed protein product [Rotaria sp. Silwood2]